MKSPCDFKKSFEYWTQAGAPAGTPSSPASTMASRALRSMRKFCPIVLFGWKPLSMHQAFTWLGLVKFKFTGCGR